MKLYFAIIYMFVVCNIFAQNNNETIPKNNVYIKFGAGTGLSNINTSFNIAGNINGTNPNILSEVKWKNVKAINCAIHANVAYESYILTLKYFRSKIFTGSATDIDYAEDFRKSPFSELDLGSYDGYSNYFNINISKSIKMRDNLYILPTLSFKQYFNKLYLQNKQIINSESENKTRDLNSYYSANYPGFGAGVLLELHKKKFQYALLLSHYYIKYNAYGNWNLRKDFQQPKSYTHQANGNELLTEFIIAYKFNPKIHIAAGFTYNDSFAKDGIDIVYKTDGNILKTKLNEIKTNSLIYTLQLVLNINR